MKATIRSLALLAWLVVLSTCGGGDSTPPVAVFITPTTVSLKPGEVQNFDATVTGTAHTGSGNSVVNWTVQEGATGGSVTDNGVYTPDITNGTFHVIATSQADTSKSATAIVTVSGPFLSLRQTRSWGLWEFKHSVPTRKSPGAYKRGPQVASSLPMASTPLPTLPDCSMWWRPVSWIQVRH